jgi:hypothetical protein
VKLKGIVVAMILGSCMGTGAAMQKPASQSSAPDPFGLPSDTMQSDDQFGDAHRRMEMLRVKSANAERQKQLTREATELLNVAGELHFKAQKSDGSVTQAEMLRQAETIERLAHNVKERMKGSR